MKGKVVGVLGAREPDSVELFHNITHDIRQVMFLVSHRYL